MVGYFAVSTLQHPHFGNLLCSGSVRFLGTRDFGDGRGTLMVATLRRPWLNPSCMLRSHLSVTEDGQVTIGPAKRDAAAEVQKQNLFEGHFYHCF